MADLDRLREDLGAFAAAVGHPLTDWQARALDLETRVTCILAPRQTGKSRSLALLGLHWAFARRGQHVLVVSAGEEAARRLLGEVRRIAVASPLLAGSVVDEAAMLLRLSNGSTIRSTPASERQIRGWSADLLVLDEAALVSDDVALGAAFPTTAARPDARVVMASSPWAEGGFFFEHVHAGDSEHVRVRRWRLEDCGWISSAAVEAARQSMSSARFAAEFEARWASSVDALFGRALLERCSADVELPSLERLHGPARLLGGADWGVTTDRSAVGWIARLPVGALNGDADPGRPVFVASASAWPAGTPLSDVVDAVAGSPAHWRAFSSETNGVGAGPSQELFRRLAGRPAAVGGGRRPRWAMIEENGWDDDDPFRRAAVGLGEPTFGFDRPAGWHGIRNPVATSAQSKALVYERLRWLCDRGQLVFPRDGELLRELAALRIELRPGGSEKVEAGRGHDDLADSLYLAAGPHRHPSGRGLRCYLDRVAGGGVPEARVPETDEPVVETGGGLRVWRRPALQSVSGVELTLPGVEPPPATPSVRISPSEAARRRIEANVRGHYGL